MEDDKAIVHDLTNSSVKPKNILTNLKKKRQESITNIKQVYNERHKFKKSKRGRRITLLGLYKMPLFEIVGGTSTDMTYSVGFAFMTTEKEDNFTRALQMLLKFLKSNSDMPKVVVTNRDTTLMNAKETVFLDSSAVLCYFHLEKKC